jgi:hypothetical protein
VQWVINIPVWGEVYRERWLRNGYSAIVKALDFASYRLADYRWIVHTDDEAAFNFPKAMSVAFRPRPREIVPTRELGTADRNGFKATVIGETIVFLNADMVPSIEMFVCIERAVKNGKKFVSCPSIRINDPHVRAFSGMRGAALADAAWDWRHPFTEDCVWKRGRCQLPPYVIFEKDDVPNNVVMHAFDLHPLAIHKDREFDLVCPTASEIIEHFAPHEIHIVRSASEMIIAEPCSPKLDYLRTKSKPFTKDDVVWWAQTHLTAPQQQEQFRRQIVLKGFFDPQAQSLANEIYARVVAPERAIGGPHPDQPVEIGFKLRLPRFGFNERRFLGMLVPRRIRLLFPKWLREWWLHMKIVKEVR